MINQAEQNSDSVVTTNQEATAQTAALHSLRDCGVPGADELRDYLAYHRDPSSPYEPGLDAVHSSSRGFVHRVVGMTTGRVHHLQSRFEYWLLLLFDMSRVYAQILEGLALPMALTLHFAAMRGYKHPYDWKRRRNAQMTVDFVLRDHQGCWTAVDFKQSFELKRPRVQQKLELARLALAEIGVAHTVVTERDIPAGVIANYRVLHTLGTPFEQPPIAETEIERADLAMRRRLLPGKMTLRQAAESYNTTTALGSGRLIRTALWLIARGRWEVDLTRPLSADHPVKFLK